MLIQDPREAGSATSRGAGRSLRLRFDMPPDGKDIFSG